MVRLPPYYAGSCRVLFSGRYRSRGLGEIYTSSLKFDAKQLFSGTITVKIYGLLVRTFSMLLGQPSNACR